MCRKLDYFFKTQLAIMWNHLPYVSHQVSLLFDKKSGPKMGDLARDKQFYLSFKNGQLQINLKKGYWGT